MSHIVYLEWFATFLSIIGILLIALRKNKYFLIIPWVLWLISGFIFSFIFYKNQQNGMLFGQIFGIFTSLLGLFQWIRNTENTSNKLLHNIIMVAITLFILNDFYRIFNVFNNPSLTNLEWLSSSFGITASLIMASRIKYSFCAWYFWSLSNSIAAYTSFQHGQMGIFTLQLAYMVMNIIGCTKWTYDFFRKENNQQ